ncbi:MAG: thiamine biosynthesis protein ThiJ [Blastocatellia bacterium AA13]|nr:MAG: thiamine biosynthesis protein ThiJ [Blastocatellia bacterium AA13]
MTSSLNIGIAIFPQCDLLDITGPYEVFAQHFHNIYLIAADMQPVETDSKLKVVPDYTFDDAPSLHLLVVPGGLGQIQMMTNKRYIAYLNRAAEAASHVMGVCTGSLLMAAAGLLDGHEATTHWDSLPCLNLFPQVMVSPGYPRYVVSGSRITTSGVSAGIDGALKVVALLAGDEAAKEAQLLIQYAPQPPFSDGDPNQADPGVYRKANQALKQIQETRLKEIIKLLNLC